MAYSSFCFMIQLVVMCSVLFKCSSDSSVKGCPFDSIYSFGVSTDSSPINELATAFHLPSPKPYTRQQVHGRLPYGASFATANAMVLGKPFLDEQGLITDSIISQLVSFSDYLLPICIFPLECRRKLGRALFLVDHGSNDYKYAFLNGKSILQVEDYTSVIVTNIVSMVSEIKKQGISNILVPGMLPIGCLPGYASLLLQKANPDEFDGHNCHVGLNNLAKNHNDQLKLGLFRASPHGPYVQHKVLTEPGEIDTYSQILYADYYNAFMELIHETESKNTRALFQEDGFHLSQEANKYIVGKLVSGNNFVRPQFHLPLVNHCVM